MIKSHFNSASLLVLSLIALMPAATTVAKEKPNQLISHGDGKSTEHKKREYKITCKAGQSCINAQSAGTHVTFSEQSVIKVSKTDGALSTVPLIGASEKARITIANDSFIDVAGNSAPALLAQAGSSIVLGRRTTVTIKGDSSRTGAATIADGGIINTDGTFYFMGEDPVLVLHTTKNGVIDFDKGGHIKGMANESTPVIRIDQGGSISLNRFRNGDGFLSAGVQIEAAPSEGAEPGSASAVYAIQLQQGGKLNLSKSSVAADFEVAGGGLINVIGGASGGGRDGGAMLSIEDSELTTWSAAGSILTTQKRSGTTHVKIGPKTVMSSSGVMVDAYDAVVIDASGADNAKLRGNIALHATPLELKLGSKARWNGNIVANAGSSAAIQLDGSSQWFGNAISSADASIYVSVDGRGHWTGASNNANTVTIKSAGAWTVTADSTVKDSIYNSGKIAFAPQAWATLNTSFYEGRNGEISLHAELGGNNSRSDRLAFDTQASGKTTLRIITSGKGSQTTGPGIAVVVASGTGAHSEDGAFSLERGKLSTGAYTYELVRGVPGSRDLIQQNSWYLRSSKNVAPLTTRPMPQVRHAILSDIHDAGNRASSGLNSTVNSPTSDAPIVESSWPRSVSWTERVDPTPHDRSSVYDMEDDDRWWEEEETKFNESATKHTAVRPQAQLFPLPASEPDVVARPLSLPATGFDGVSHQSVADPASVASETHSGASSPGWTTPVGQLSDASDNTLVVEAVSGVPPRETPESVDGGASTPASLVSTSGASTPSMPQPSAAATPNGNTLPLATPAQPAGQFPATGSQQPPVDPLPQEPDPAGAPEFDLARAEELAQEPLFARPTLPEPPPAAQPQPAQPQPEPPLAEPAPAEPLPEPTPAEEVPAAQPPVETPVATPAPARQLPAPAAASAIPVTPTGDGGYVVPMYRAETVLYAAIPDVARTLSLATAGTRHDRHGASLMRGDGSPSFAGSWARAFGGRLTEGASNSLTPSVNGHYAGIQIGADLLGYATEYGDGRFGVFGGYASAHANVRGFAEGVRNMAVGSLSLSATSAGAYWTHTGPGGWYVDATLTGSHYVSGGKSINGLSPKTAGRGTTLSLEAGLPIALGHGLTFEPQAQVIYRTLAMQPAKDAYSTMRFRTHSGARMRVGGRLSWETVLNGVTLKPYVQASLWSETGALDRTIYNQVTSIASGSATRGADIDLGLEANVSDNLAIWAAAGVTRDLKRPEGRADRSTWRLKAGLRYQW